MAELGGGVAPVPADAYPLEALTRFERDPVGVVAWLGIQGNGIFRTGKKGEVHGQPPHLVPRWAAAIRAEARQRLMEVQE